MTRADLDRYHDIVTRLKILQTTVVTDSVVGSSPDYPYVAHSITLHGIRKDEAAVREVNELTQKKAAIDRFIDSIQDERVRTLLDLLYRKDMKWNDVEAKTGGSYNADIKYLQRFFKMSTNVH